MGVCFRRFAHLGPLRFNFSSGGLISIFVGGPRTTVGLPGTGLSWSVEHTPDRTSAIPTAIPAGPAAGLPDSLRLRPGQLLADGGIVAGIFPGLIGVAWSITLRRPARLLLEGVWYQKARGVPDRWRLGQPSVAPRHVIPAGADQVELEGIDELLADLGGGGHGSVGL